jgi:phosphomannomutase
MSLMVSISGIRGIVGQSLTPEVIVRYAAGFAEYCQRRYPNNAAVVVGRDGRLTGGFILDLVAGTLAAKGMTVRSLNICPTPTVQLAVEREGAAGGIVVTASHNPIEWNGMKFIASTGMFLDADENHDFWALSTPEQSYPSWEGTGKLITDSTWLRKHIDAVLGLPFLNPARIRRRGLTVVLDCINAAGGVIVPQLLQELGCTVFPLHCDVSGVFARTPEPVPENLHEVAEKVRSTHADLGIVVDPDVDRLVLINELGEPYGEEYTIATAVDFVLSHASKSATTVQAGATTNVVVNLSTTRAVDDIATRYGVPCTRTPVGEINVARRMKADGAIIGGEGSGGVILPAVHLGRDAIVGIALILQALADSGKTLSQIKLGLPEYHIAKGKVPLGSTNPDEVIARLEATYAGTARVNRDDGIKFDFPDSWVHLRKSNTEPVIRLIAEARTMKEARAVLDQVKKDTGLR